MRLVLYRSEETESFVSVLMFYFFLKPSRQTEDPQTRVGTTSHFADGWVSGPHSPTVGRSVAGLTPTAPNRYQCPRLQSGKFLLSDRRSVTQGVGVRGSGFMSSTSLLSPFCLNLYLHLNRTVVDLFMSQKEKSEILVRSNDTFTWEVG